MTVNFRTAYVSGPMTGYEDFNFPAFDSCAGQLRSEGVEVFSPADHDRETIAELWPGKKPEDFDGYKDGDITRYFDAVSSGGKFTLDSMLAWDFAVIGEEAEVIIMLPGWEKSSGARAERFVAEMTKTPVWLANETWVWDITNNDDERAHKRAWYFTLDDNQKRMTPPSVQAGPAWVVASDDPGFQERAAADRAAFEAEKAVKRFWSSSALLTMDEIADRALKLIGHEKEDDGSDGLVNVGEVRVVNEVTGGAKGTKLGRFDLLPPGPLLELAEHYGRGSQKYEDRNWEKGYNWGLSFGALMRHAWAFWGGEDIDAETGGKHIIAVAWHALALAEFMQTHPELDTRPASQGE